MEHSLVIKVDDPTLQALQARADGTRQDLDLVAARLLAQATRLFPAGGRIVVLSGDALQEVESLLGGGSILNGTDLQRKVARLAGISFLHIRLPFTPGQLEMLAEKAARQGLTVEQLAERTAPRMYEQFFDLVARV